MVKIILSFILNIHQERKISSSRQGCQTCACNTEISANICPPMKCDLECKYGFERDPSGCSLCSCNKCPMHNCRRFCMYGFKKNSDGCDSCECDWAPIAEKIPCSEV